MQYTVGCYLGKGCWKTVFEMELRNENACMVIEIFLWTIGSTVTSLASSIWGSTLRLSETGEIASQEILVESGEFMKTWLMLQFLWVSCIIFLVCLTCICRFSY